MKLMDALPAPTRNLDQAKKDLREQGVCIMPDALEPDLFGRVNAALAQAASGDPARRKAPRLRLDYGDSNQRIWALLNRDPVFAELAEHPIGLELLRDLLGWPLLLSNISANITGPGGEDSMMHCDQQYMPTPWGGPQGLNLIYCLTDFTAENGATVLVPGSHRWNEPPVAGEADDVPGVPLVAPAGSLCAMEGRVWHKTGRNVTDGDHRAGIFAWYTLPVYRQQENWYLSLNPSALQFASPTLLELLGYETQGFGLVNGMPPLWRDEGASTQ